MEDDEKEVEGADEEIDEETDEEEGQKVAEEEDGRSRWEMNYYYY